MYYGHLPFVCLVTTWSQEPNTKSPLLMLQMLYMTISHPLFYLQHRNKVKIYEISFSSSLFPYFSVSTHRLAFASKWDISAGNSAKKKKNQVPPWTFIFFPAQRTRDPLFVPPHQSTSASTTALVSQVSEAGGQCCKINSPVTCLCLAYSSQSS